MTDMTPTAELSQIILLNTAFRHRGDPLAMPPDTKIRPQQLTVEVTATPFTDEGAIGVRVTVASDPGEEDVLYDFSVTMTGILVRTQATPAEWSERNFAEIGVTMLYPFVREAVANITGRGRFGPVWINPFNVRALFERMNNSPAAAEA